MVRGAHTAAMPPTPDPDVLDEQMRTMRQRRATMRLASEIVLNHGANTNSNTTRAHDDDDDDDGDNPEPRGCLPNRGSKQKARRSEGSPGNPGNPGDHAVVIVRPAATAAAAPPVVARRRNRADTPPTASNRFGPIAPFEPDKSDTFAVVVLFLLLLGVVACAVAFPYQGVLDLDADRGAFERTLLRWVAAREALAAEERGEALAPFPDAEAAAPFSGIEAFLAPTRNA